MLEKQRFQFPPSWLYIDNIEGEWGAFSDIMKRKDTAIQQQVANLQMKIVQEDKAVENRTTDLLNDWEKTKPVAVRNIYLNKFSFLFIAHLMLDVVNIFRCITSLCLSYKEMADKFDLHFFFFFKCLICSLRVTCVLKRPFSL